MGKRKKKTRNGDRLVLLVSLQTAAPKYVKRRLMVKYVSVKVS